MKKIIGRPFRKGMIPWNKGISMSLETKLKLSNAKKSQIPWNKGLKSGNHGNGFQRGQIGANRGKTFSQEVREKMSLAHKRTLRSKKFYRKIGLKGVIAQEQKPTSIETKLYQELKDRGLLFEKQKLINGKFLVDAYIPSLNLVIEADGDYWHTLDRVAKKDKAENAYLTKCGFNLLRLTETEIRNNNFLIKLSNLRGGENFG